MNKNKNIILGIFLILLAFLLVALGYYFFKNNLIQKTLKSQEKKTNLPGILFGPEQSSRAENLDAEKIIEWTNYYRNQNGLDNLQSNSLLTKAAQEKVRDSFKNQYFDHISPDGITPAKLVSSVGYSYRVTGENLALGDFENEKDLVDVWMASLGHRENILNPDYTEIGVASGLQKYQDRGMTWISVQEFGKPSPICSKPDKDLSTEIENNKKEYENLINESDDLYLKASEVLKTGNQIYKETKDKDQAQAYWDQAIVYQEEADAKRNEAQNLQAEISSDIATYNYQVNEYNTCIKD